MTIVEQNQLAADVISIGSDSPDYAIVYRINSQAAGGLERIERLNLSVFGIDGEDAIEDHVQKTHGPGTYKIDFRKSGKRGSVGSPRTFTAAAKSPAQIAEEQYLAHKLPLPGQMQSAPAADSNQAFLQSMLLAMMNAQAQMFAAAMGRPADTTFKELLPHLLHKPTPVAELAQTLELAKQLAPQAVAGSAGDDELIRLLGTAASVVDRMMQRQPQPPQLPAGHDRRFANPQLPAQPAVVHPVAPQIPAQPMIAHNAPPSISPSATTPAPPATVAAPLPAANPAPDTLVNSPDALADRFTQALAVFRATANSERDPDTYAQLIIDAVGVDEADSIALLSNESALGFVIGVAPDLEPQRGFLTEVLQSIRSIIEDAPAGADGFAHGGNSTINNHSQGTVHRNGGAPAFAARR